MAPTRRSNPWYQRKIAVRGCRRRLRQTPICWFRKKKDTIETPSDMDVKETFTDENSIDGNDSLWILPIWRIGGKEELKWQRVREITMRS